MAAHNCSKYYSAELSALNIGVDVLYEQSVFYQLSVRVHVKTFDIDVLGKCLSKNRLDKPWHIL